MFTQPHNQNLLNDVMKILGGGDKPENNIKPAPQWVVDASHGAAQSLTEAYQSGQVITSETKRDILRKHLDEAVRDCGCSVGKEDPIHFEKEVEKRMNEGIVPTNKLATPKVVAQKTAKPPTKSIPVNKGLASQKEELESVDEAAVSVGRTFRVKGKEFQVDKSPKGGYDINRLSSGMRFFVSNVKSLDKKEIMPPIDNYLKDQEKRRNQFLSTVKKENVEQIAADMRYFLEQLTREEVEVLTDVVLEATMTKKQLEKAVNDTFYKHFNKVQIDMMSIPRLYKEIEAGLSAGKSPDDFVPDLVKKYRKN